MTCLQNLPSACDLHCLLSLSVICSPGKHQIWHILLKYGQTACRSPSSEFAMTCLQNWLPACDLHCSPRFGVYFLRGSYSCMRPFSENLRLCGAVGVPAVSRCPDHNFWRTCDCRLFGFPVHFHLGAPVSPRPVSRCGGFVVV